MTTKEQVLHHVEFLGEDELRQLARYIERLRSRSRKPADVVAQGDRSVALPRPASPPYRPSFDPEQAAALYAACAEEDRLLAEQGMEDYADQLVGEDGC